MATYPPVTTPADGSFVAVPSATTDRIAVAYQGPVWISDDAVPSVQSAIPLVPGPAYLLKAGVAISVARAGSGQAQLRLMDN